MAGLLQSPVLRGSDLYPSKYCIPAVPPHIGLFFMLRDRVYQPGDTILITAVGNESSPSDPGAALVCETSNVNTQCCRTSDGGNVGEWLFPNGSLVPGNFSVDEELADFTRTGFFQQVRLNRINSNALMPSGAYECRVPSENGSVIHVASITLQGTCMYAHTVKGLYIYGERACNSHSNHSSM